MKRKLTAACILLTAAAVVLYFLLLRPGSGPDSVRVFVDGEELSSQVFSPNGEVLQPLVLSPEEQDLRVIVTLDGKEIANLPFGEAHTVRVLQENRDENTVRITGDSVLMESANCEGQDCVHMEKVTRDNLETRVMFGMIICLPHRLSVEVR